MNFEGVFPAVVTPFDDGGSILSQHLIEHVQWQIECGVTGIVGTGTMGEASSLSRDERREVLGHIVAAADGRVRVSAGVSADTAEKAATYAKDAAAAGATGIMCLPPLGFAATRRELHAFFRTVAGATDLPLMLYNNPHASGGTDVRSAVIAELCTEIDTLVGVKETSGDARRIAEIQQATSGDVEVLVGGDDWPIEGAAAGATGWVSGVINVAPAETIELWRRATAGELGAAREIYARLAPLARLDMTPKLVQYFKGALDEIGRYGGPCRAPRLPLEDEDRVILDDAMRALRAGVA